MRRLFRLRRRPGRVPLRWVLLALLLASVLYFRLSFLPLAQRLIRAEVDNEISNLINEAVDAWLAQDQLRYEDLVRLQRRADGSLAAAGFDLGRVNRMKSHILRELGERVPSRVSQTVRVPLGSVVLPALFSGRGAGLGARVVSLRSSNAELVSDFEAAGINQTLHRLELRVEVELLLLTPAGLINRQVCTEVPIAQTILLGQVPNILLSPP